MPQDAAWPCAVRTKQARCGGVGGNVRAAWSCPDRPGGPPTGTSTSQRTDALADETRDSRGPRRGRYQEWRPRKSSRKACLPSEEGFPRRGWGRGSPGRVGLHTQRLSRGCVRHEGAQPGMARNPSAQLQSGRDWAGVLCRGLCSRSPLRVPAPLSGGCCREHGGAFGPPARLGASFRKEGVQNHVAPARCRAAPSPTGPSVTCVLPARWGRRDR